ncbi:hypothetical protein KKA01_02880 [Patescibacteria group bacterium]|nr:hypothetical protein [Patescibacteria group bacterium]
MKKLGNKLYHELKPGTTIICNNFSLPNWKPANKEGKFYVYEKGSG